MDTSTPDPSPDSINAFRTHLLEWFAANRRDLPWRRTRDPYRIMVSEVMLQQTQVDRVIPYYDRWLEEFPDVASLAAAPTPEVIRLWAGLGYNRRAVNLQRTAQAVVNRGGEFPADVSDLLDLPGIGPYTAGAIACFAFEQDVAFVDTNMRRVLHRVLVGSELPEWLATDKELVTLSSSAMPVGSGWEWNQALIEFGALHCTARKPLCLICPLQSTCAAWPEIQSLLVAKPRKTSTVKQVPFKETNRYFRGRIVDALREHTGTGMPLSVLGPYVRPAYEPADGPWLLKLVQGLERDGLASIAEPAAPYDAGEPVIKLPEGTS